MSSNNQKAIQQLSAEQLEQLWLKYGLDKDGLAKVSENDFPQLLLKIESSDRPGLRARFDSESLVDKNGDIGIDVISKSHTQHIGALKANKKQSRTAGVPTGPGLVRRSLVPIAMNAGMSATNTGWSALGPSNVGGRTRSIVFQPGNPAIMWAGSSGGGVWRSHDSGTSWEPTEDLMANLAIGSLVAHPDKSNHLFAGTGDGFNHHNISESTENNSFTPRGNGIFKTTDGWNWSVIESTKDKADFHYCNALVFDQVGRTLLAGTETGIFYSTDIKHEVWTQAIHKTSSTTHTSLSDPISSISVQPGISLKLVASTKHGLIYFSEDGGLSWSKAHIPSHHHHTKAGRIVVSYAAKNPEYVYASVNRGTSEVWLSTDGGKTFVKKDTQLASGLPAPLLGNQGNFANALWVDPTNENFIIVGGLDLYKSTNAGDTFTRISNWSKVGSVHADHHLIVAHPEFDGDNNKEVYFGNDGGIYKTSDIRTAGNNADLTHGWLTCNENYAVTLFYHGAGNHSTQTIIGGAQDRGTQRKTSSDNVNQWKKIHRSDGGFVASDPHDNNYYYGETPNLGLFRNTHGALAEENILTTYITGCYYHHGWKWKEAPHLLEDAKNKKAAFIAPFILDPNNSQRLLAGGSSLWRTNDVKTAVTRTTGPEWAVIKAPIENNYISAIAVAEGNSDLAYVGYTNGEIYKTLNATQSHPDWLRVDVHPNDLPHGVNDITAKTKCQCIYIDKSDHNIVFATYSGYQKNNLWMTRNGGAAWDYNYKNLPECAMRCITAHPKNHNYLYLGTDQGLYVSEDRGQNWAPTNEGPTNCQVSHLFWLKNHLVAVTFGRGMFQINLSLQGKPDRLLIVNRAGDILGINPDHGQLMTTGGQPYKLSLGKAANGGITLDKTLAYVATSLINHDNTLYAFNPRNHQQTWTQPIPGGVVTAPEIYEPSGSDEADRMVVVVDSWGSVFAFKWESGSPVWHHNLFEQPGSGNQYVSISGTAIVNDRLYITSDRGTVVFNLLDKTTQIVSDKNSKIPPLVVNNMLFVAAEGIVYAYGARTLSLKWQWMALEIIEYPLYWINGAIVVISKAHPIQGLRYTDSFPLFSIIPKGFIDSVTVDNHTLYVTSSGVMKITAYEVNPMQLKANEKWTFTIRHIANLDTAGSQLPGLIKDSVIYLPFSDNSLRAYHLDTGGELWRTDSHGAYDPGYEDTPVAFYDSAMHRPPTQHESS